MKSNHKLANALLKIHSAEQLRASHESFTWRKKALAQAWQERCSLSDDLVKSLEDQAKFDEAIKKIHKWGFGGSPPESAINNDSLRRRMRELLDTDNLLNDDILVDHFTEMLNLRGVGIARASKWICLLDQTRFAIYDSRVSVALREVEIDDHRAFPILPRQESKRHIQWLKDTIKPSAMAKHYLGYLETIRAVATKVELLPAEIEMALFMLGDKSCDDPEWRKSRKPLNKAV